MIPGIPGVATNVRDYGLPDPAASNHSSLEEGREEKSDTLLAEVSNLLAQDADATGGEAERSG